MAWPKGRERPRKVKADQPVIVPVEVEQEEELARDPSQPPAFWTKGQLLNVRNRGDAYVITVWPEEYSDEHPERAMRFTNLGECQGFVSAWYAREHHNPLAR